MSHLLRNLEDSFAMGLIIVLLLIGCSQRRFDLEKSPTPEQMLQQTQLVPAMTATISAANPAVDQNLIATVKTGNDQVTFKKAEEITIIVKITTPITILSNYSNGLLPLKVSKDLYLLSSVMENRSIISECLSNARHRLNKITSS
jgi:hypothetical protein